ncbi:MAG: hypothetical protein RMJ88_03305, partial [Thermogemmata sp.]|nr:hypothetical protein [Thermogemmata sp.]
MSSKLAAASEGAEDPLPWSTATRAALQRRLLEWYGTHRRPFPWRQNRDPYRIWVSEVMLQQTTAP